jgi:hypothetical protein
MQEPMPQTPEQRARERLSWLTPEARSALGNRAALDLCFSEDIDMAWKVRKDGTYVVKRIKGVSPLGKAFLMVHGGASVIKGMTEEQFDALPGRSDLCLSEELPPDPEMDDFHIKPADKARLHPFYAGLKVNPAHGFDDQGRPIYVYHLDAKYAHLPREDEADIDARVIVQDNLVVGVQAVTQRGGFILDDMATRLEDKGKTLLGCKFKGLFENIAVWSGRLRLAVTDMS